ncbi:MAG: D-hexose-6-phosphate mutarotase [Gammaproteobacteria bacterium]|nr:D-hexose-6-phosphate mutarotase [Gammaproteobacteria bacterium]
MNHLNDRYGIDGCLSFQKGEGGLTKAVISNQHAQAEVYLHGGQLTHYQPENAEPVIWMSQDAVFSKDKAIRGGIPICWPWFGPHASNVSLPQHGFVRTAAWSVIASDSLPDGSTRLCLGLEGDGSNPMWPYSFELVLAISVGPQLQLALTAMNTSDETVDLGAAFHTYFVVGESAAIRISGLDGCKYLDKPDNYALKNQDGDITIDGEVDRVYLETLDDCVIDDPILKRRIIVSKEGSASTIVWNPGSDNAKAMADFNDGGYHSMVCIESANAADDIRQLVPGEAHTLVQRIAISSVS